MDNDKAEFYNFSRLDKLIKRRYGKNIPQSVIEKAVRNRDILVNGEKIPASSQVSDDVDIYIHESVLRKFEKFSNENNKAFLDSDRISEEFRNFIIYEDDNFIIINKPSGLAVQLGTGTNISVDVMAKYYNSNANLVHRIDKDTSGITVLSKNIQSSRYMLNLFKTKNIKKKYVAVVCGDLKKDYGKISEPLLKNRETVVVDYKNGKEAITEYKVIKRLSNNMILVELSPLTGRTHQLRVHMQCLGCSILGDTKYGGKKYKKLCLHASEIFFKDLSGKVVRVESDFPEYFII